MGSYAPLFCNANHKAWPVNLINFDSHRWFGLPSYYVQQLFSSNQGTVTLPVAIDNVPTLKAPSASGGIGLGTWNNAAEFKNIKVLAPDGSTLFQPDLDKEVAAAKSFGHGRWTVDHGVLRQTALEPFVTLYMGDTTWTDYTITLQARKLGGENGFQIFFHHHPRSGRFRWDLGGYNNSSNVLDIGVTSANMKGSIDTMRWYDVKLEIRGNTVRGYLDGTLVQEAGDARSAAKCVFASAVKDEKSGDVIVKVVNASFDAIAAQVDLKGAAGLTGKGKAIVLASGSSLDENTLEEPTKVAPQTEAVKFSGSSLTRSFPGNSLTVLRLATAEGKK